MHDKKIENKAFEFIYFSIFCLVILFFSSTYFISHWWAHALVALLACCYLKKISHYSITWVLIANAAFFSNQPRFSLEFLLITLGLCAWAFRAEYRKINKNQRFALILVLILISVIFTLMGKSLNEKYAFLGWLPILITIYFPVKEFIGEKKNLIATISSTILVSLSSKKSVILSFLAQYLSVVKTIKAFIILALVSISIFFTSFFFQDNIKLFYSKSIAPRLTIWQATTKGFLSKPITGNGFGIFPIEINNHRGSVQRIGGKLNAHVNHAHNNILNIAFEQGLIGLGLLGLLLFFLYTYYRSCFWSFLAISLLDASLNYSMQYFFAALIFVPCIFENKAIVNPKFLVIPEKYKKVAYRFLLFLCLITFGFSIIGHYYYDNKKYDKAIKFDSDHSLYHFFAGVKNFKRSNFKNAALHFEKSISLSKNHGFQQGFLAVSYYALNKKELAQKWITETMRLAEDEAQWKYVAHILFRDTDPEYSRKLKYEAIKMDPVLLYYDKGIMPPRFPSIGGNEGSFIWINSYQRRGEKVYLPTPQY